MPAWPTSLPAFDAQGFQESAPDNLLRTQMDAGPDKVRRRYTAAARGLQGTILLDETQYATFKTFHGTDLADGALPFTMTNPYGGGTATYRFTGGWSASLVGGGQYVSVSLPLEKLP